MSRLLASYATCLPRALRVVSSYCCCTSIVRRLALLALLLAAAACRAAPTPSRQLVLLAVDGLDHGILSRLIAERRLPHLGDLARRSGVVRVTSTPGAEPASAWASFATGSNPGVHGVFDAVAPDPSTGAPRAATLVLRPSSRWFGTMWREGAAYAVARRGTAFWSTLGEAGIASRLLFVPGTFPPEPVPSGTMVSGTPLPDWGGGWGTGYTWLASNLPAGDEGFTRHGGRQVRLAFNRRTAHATLLGLRAPETIEVPFSVTWSPEDRSANITVGDSTAHLNEGQQSRWLSIGARVSFLTRVQGLVRVHLVEAGNDVRVYVSAIQWHPAAPPSPIASPPGAATTLLARLGPFRTLAWPESGWALADGRIERDAFVAAHADTFDDRAAALLSEAESTGWQLLIAGIETLDSVSRLRWLSSGAATGSDFANPSGIPGALIAAYEQLDRLVGDLRKRLPADADVALVSPHGVAPVRRFVDLNRWLTERGWLAWRHPPPPVTLAALADPAIWPDAVDWSRTAARAVGAGHIYLSPDRRQSRSALDGDADEAARLAALQQALMELSDPISGRQVVARVRSGHDAYPRGRLEEVPDLVVTFAAGYGGSLDSMLGGMAPQVVSPNDERWRAGAAAIDEQSVPGVWLSTIPLQADAISVLDIAPTVAEYFGTANVAAVEGRSQLRDKPSSTSRRK